MKQVRRGVFETNSSSTHSITLCMKEDYDKWKNGEVFLNKCWSTTESQYKNKKFVTKEEILDIFMYGQHLGNSYKELIEITDDGEFEDFVRDWDFFTYDNYNSDCLEDFETTFITPNGDVVMAFGQYGYDG